ncbi:hypothetical protein [Bradyrhizobium genosp. P]|uniref:hypothetical protein n=1 Tax=Bradyrhizobium genosp. P TaxID=83641 RepID=UPI003CF4810D
MLNPSKMRGHEILIFWVLTLTTVFGGLIYLAYLGVVYRMDRDSPIVGQQILTREAVLAKDAQERRDSFFRFIKNRYVWGSLAAIIVLRLIYVGAHPPVVPATVAAVTPSALPISDGCDLAGAVADCKAVVAGLVAKGVKGAGAPMEATKSPEHADGMDKPIMSKEEWAEFQAKVSRQRLEQYEAEREVDDARKNVDNVKRMMEQERLAGRAPLR